ncbi:MAG: flagellar M-ring protein FliF [Rhodospirillales bacterium]|nr:flagellar M-ring protein FliF [Rhodospirillales bacterium]
MDALFQAIRNLGPMRLAVMGGVVLSMVGFFIYITSRLATPNMELLYADLDQKDSGKIVQTLESMQIPYEIAGGGSIKIPGGDVSRVRLILADQGIPGGGTIGYEIFDDAESLGTTNFMQNVNLVRALEGELSRTIQSIGSISSARVHLVLPKRELFSRERQEPTASIILNMSGGKRLEKGQILAVQHLVATAVPDLLPTRVSIVDNKGKLLAAGYEDENDIGTITDKTTERTRIFENRMARTIEELLEKTVGFGKVRAEVNAELDFDRVSTQEEIYDPDGQVVRSTQTSEQISSAKDSEGNSAVTVDANLPDPGLSAEEGVSSSADDSRIDETVNFEITKRVINHVKEVGSVKRLSVSVLVDGVRGINELEEKTYEDRSQQDMELLSTLVRGAIGFNADRGDIVEIINMEFADFVEEEEDLELFFGMDKNDLLRLAEFMVLGIVAILVILLVVRPLISRAIESLPSADQLAGERLLADQTASQALTGPGGAPIPGESLDSDVEQFEELIDIDRVEGRVKASSVKKVGEIVEKHPEEALSIIRNWMYQEN